MEGISIILGAGFAVLAALLWRIRQELIGIRELLSKERTQPPDPSS